MAGVGKRSAASARLRRRSDYQYVREHGQSAVGRYCVVRAVAPPDGQGRVGWVISRHFSKRAVDRNRARRLFREAYRQLFPELSSCWLEMRPRAFMMGIKLADLQPELERLLKRLQVLRHDGGTRAGRLGE